MNCTFASEPPVSGNFAKTACTFAFRHPSPASSAELSNFIITGKTIAKRGLSSLSASMTESHASTTISPANVTNLPKSAEIHDIEKILPQGGESVRRRAKVRSSPRARRAMWKWLKSSKTSPVPPESIGKPEATGITAETSKAGEASEAGEFGAPRSNRSLSSREQAAPGAKKLPCG